LARYELLTGETGGAKKSGPKVVRQEKLEKKKGVWGRKAKEKSCNRWGNTGGSETGAVERLLNFRKDLNPPCKINEVFHEVPRQNRLQKQRKSSSRRVLWFGKKKEAFHNNVPRRRLNRQGNKQQGRD